MAQIIDNSFPPLSLEVEMDSPKTDKDDTRFSTPVSDLDDHRQQLSIPPAVPPTTPTHDIRGRMGTISSIHETRPDFLTVADHYDAGLMSPTFRDFEQAIIDDDRSGTDENPNGFPTVEGGVKPKRGFSRRVQQKIEEMGRSRDESPSSNRSTSPPNSVDAFAEPRRRERANTFASKAPSDLDLQRTVSGGTQQRRPTFSNISIRHGQADVIVDSDRPEEDVCFPQQEEPTKTFTIDYEEMTEFVAESRRGRPVGLCRQKHSFSSQGGKRPNLTIPKRQSSIPTIVEPNVSAMGRKESFEITGSEESTQNEKVGNGDFGIKPMERRPSVMEPNRFSFFSSELEQTIHAPELGDLIMPDESFRDLFELPSEKGSWWLDVMNPTEDELEMFQKAFGIHRLTSEDIERQEIREKVELFKQYYFVCFRSFSQMDKNSEDYLEPVNVYMVVFREGILTFTYAPSPHAAEVRKRIGKLRNYINLTADWICYAMVDNIVDSFGPVIRTIEIETDQIEDQVFVARSEDFASLLRQIGECRKKVMSLMRLLGGKADVIKGFAKRCNEQYSVAPRGEIGLYLGDIQDHVVTMMSNLGHFEKMLSRSHSNYLAQLSVDNIAQGNRANEVLGKITLIATVLVPMNFICGLFGMNVPVPGGVTGGSLGWFFGIIGIIAAIVGSSLIWAKKMKYI